MWKAPACKRGDAFGDQRGAAIDEARRLGAVRNRLARDLVVVALVGLAEIRRVRVRNRALRTHPVQRGAGVEAAREREPDLLADGNGLQDVRHGSTWWTAESVILEYAVSDETPGTTMTDTRRSTATRHGSDGRLGLRPLHPRRRMRAPRARVVRSARQALDPAGQEPVTARRRRGQPLPLGRLVDAATRRHVGDGRIPTLNTCDVQRGRALLLPRHARA